MRRELRDETLAYHAARLLLLVGLAGKPQHSVERRPGITGRMLLAKLDFFLRYPSYLEKAAAILEEQLPDLRSVGYESVETRMVRYLYGPWDHVYYSALAYLIGKRLIHVERVRGTEVFRLTEPGSQSLNRLLADPAYDDLRARARMVYHLFNRFSGTRLKEFIYLHFPEVVGRRLGALI